MEPEFGRCTDAELMAMLDENAIWTVNGRQGRIHGLTMSLRAAVQRAASFEGSRPVLLELRRQPSDKIIVSAPQLHRLLKLGVGLPQEVTETEDEVGFLDAKDRGRDAHY
jgi:hypothetical protein